MDPNQLRKFRLERGSSVNVEKSKLLDSTCFTRVEALELLHPDYAFAMSNEVISQRRLTSAVLVAPVDEDSSVSNDDTVISWSSSVFFPATRNRRDARVACVELYGCDVNVHAGSNVNG